MSQSVWGLVAKVTVWGASVVAVLSISRVSLPLEHGICGPWGCGPPVNALIACHGFWIVLFVPAAVMLKGRLSSRTQWRLGLLFTVAGFAALAGVACWDLTHWYAVASEWQRRYLPQRLLFSVATLVDVPVVEVTLLGLTWLMTSPSRSAPLARTGRQTDHEPGSQEWSDTHPQQNGRSRDAAVQ